MPPSGRLASTAPRPELRTDSRPEQRLDRVELSAPSPSPLHLKALIPPVCPLEAISAQQWKSISILKDPFVVLKRGRIGYRDLVLCLNSGLPHLVSFGLNLLQTLALDTTIPLPDPPALSQLIDRLIELYQSHSGKLPSSKRLRDTIRLRESLWFENQAQNHSSDVCDIISHIFRLWRTRYTASEVLDKHHGLTDLMLSQVSLGSFLESRGNFLAFLSDSPPTSFFGSEDVMYRFYQWSKDEIDICHDLVLSSSARTNIWLCGELRADSELEVAKKTIIQTMHMISALFKVLPPTLHLIVEIVNSSALQLASLEESVKRRMSKAVQRLFGSLLRLTTILIQALAHFTGMVQQLMSRPDFWGSVECSKWMMKMVHGASFGFSDGGYNELLLLSLKALLGALPSSGLTDEAVEVHRKHIAGLVTHAAGLRRLWLTRPLEKPLQFEKQPPKKGAKPSETTEQSPLLWQPITATTSNPYQLFVGTIGLLSGLVDSNYAAVGRVLAEGGAAEVVAGWIDVAGVGNGTSREVLGTEVLVGYYHLILESVLSHQFSLM